MFIGALALLAAGVVGFVTRRRQATLPPARAWSVYGFASWALAGFLAVGALLLSIGLCALPFAVVATFFAVRTFSIGVGTIGSVAGVGLALVLIGIVNIGNQPCPSVPFSFAPGQLGSLECGGPSPTPWLVAGVASILIAVAVTAIYGRISARR
jgi:hypothetical protein